MGWKDNMRHLQNIDSESDQLRDKHNHLPEREKYEGLANKLRDLQSALTTKRKTLDEKQSDLKKLEGELELANNKISKEEKRLYGGSVTNPKELKGIEDEIKSLRRLTDARETEVLERMDKAQKVEEDIEEKARLAKALETQAKETHHQYAKEEKKILDRLSFLEKERQKYSGGIDSPALKLYERLRQEKHGVAAAEIKSGVCQGCFVELPAEEVDSAISTDKLWRCPSCGRIII